MRWISGIALACVLAASPALAQGEKEEEPGLMVGDPAPAFSLQGSDGKTHSLEDFKGKKAVIIAWFPKAFTGG